LLAWNDSGTDRSQTENQPAKIGRGLVILGPIGSSDKTPVFQGDPNGLPPATAVPEGEFSGVAGNEIASSDAKQPTAINRFGLASDDLADRNLPARQTQQRAAAAVTVINGLSFNGGAAVAQNRAGGAEKFYRNPAGEIDADKTPVPVLGDLPVAGKTVARRARALAPITAPAPSGAPVNAGEEYLGKIEAPQNLAESAKELPQPGSSTLTLNGVNSFSGGTVINGGTLAFDDLKTASDSLSRKKDEANLGVTGPSDRDHAVFAFNLKNGEPLQTAEVEMQGTFQNSSRSANSSSQSSALQQRLQNISSQAAAGKPAEQSEVMQDTITYQTTNAVADSFAVNSGKFYSGLTGENMGGLHYMTAAPSLPATPSLKALQGQYDEQSKQIQEAQQNVEALRRDLGVTDQANASGPTPTLTENRSETAKQKDREEAKKNQSYYDQKRNLEQKLKMHELLYSKLEAEKLDLNLPKNSMVQLTDPAEPAKNQTLWQKFNGEFESKARIKVENDVTDIAGMTGMPASGGYDPYFIQTTFEIIQSGLVLSNVVDALKLDEVWAKENGGERLEKKAAIALLKKRLVLNPVNNTKLIEIGARSDNPEEAAKIANAVAEAYRAYRFETRRQLTANGLKTLEEKYAQQQQEIRLAQAEVERLAKASSGEQADVAIHKPAPNAPIPQPETLTRENAFSTFSLNVSDVSFKLAAASLEKGRMPDAASIRSEEFINAFDYRDPEAAAGQPLAFAAERARYPFAHNRDLLRFSVKTAAAGRQAGRALNLVLLLDTSGSMERADRVTIIREALRVLAAQLQPQDTVSVVTFARTARLWADGVPGDKAGETLSQVGGITPDGGTNLEEAMRLAHETARRHYLAGGMNRVVLLTDGAANLGNVDPGALKQKVEAQRRQGIALDCFGIGWEDFNDDLLEQLSGNGDGRYAFINSPEDAANDFAAKLAGALRVAAQDVKVQVEFNPQRVISWRQIGYAKHQLTKEQFRDNSVIAAEIAAQEAGNALYTVETKPDGIGPVATVRVRYRVPNTQDFHERSWDVEYAGNAPALEQSSPAMRLAATASAFSEWLAASPFAPEVTPDELLKDMSGVPQIFGADQRPAKLETMIREAKSIAGK
jgi:autotransporter-associated beta strand protein